MNRFLQLEISAIGQLSYYKKDKIKISAEQANKKVNEFTSQHIGAMIMQKCMGQAVDLNQAFSKSRDNSKKDLDRAREQIKIVSIYYQIAQQESYDELIKIESTPDFCGWVDPIQVENIKIAHIPS